jgi:hypothetical protein
MTTELIDKIKSRGYWRVIIKPTKFNKNSIPSLDECRQLIEESKVDLRGWDYPHLPRLGEGLVKGVDWIEASTESMIWIPITEYWRFYQSGQFAHLINCEEDWVSRDQLQIQNWRNLPLPERVLSISNTVYRVTEIYEFAARLATKEIFSSDLSITVELHGMKDRGLVITARMRAPLLENYICRVNDLPYPPKVVSIETLLAQSSELAFENIVWFFERFNWQNIPVHVIRDDQRRLLERRL